MRTQFDAYERSNRLLEYPHKAAIKETSLHSVISKVGYIWRGGFLFYSSKRIASKSTFADLRRSNPSFLQKIMGIRDIIIKYDLEERILHKLPYIVGAFCALDISPCPRKRARPRRQAACNRAELNAHYQKGGIFACPNERGG